MVSVGLLKPGTTIGGRFRIEGVFRREGAEFLYQARRMDCSAACTLRVLPVNATDVDALDRVVRDISGTFSGRIHSNIVRALDVAVDQETQLIGIALELLQGETLSARLRRGRILTEEAAALLQQLGQALCVAHAAGLVHGRLEPASLSLTTDATGKPSLKVSGFEVSELLAPGSDALRRNLTDPTFYSAPEHFSVLERDPAAPSQSAIGASIGVATDIWAFGLIADEMISGTSPRDRFGTATPSDLPCRFAAMRSEQAALSSARAPRAAECPSAFAEWLSRCLRVKPIERYTTAAEATDALSAALASASEIDNLGAGGGANGGAATTPSRAPRASAEEGTEPQAAIGAETASAAPGARRSQHAHATAVERSRNSAPTHWLDRAPTLLALFIAALIPMGGLAWCLAEATGARLDLTGPDVDAGSVDTTKTDASTLIAALSDAATHDAAPTKPAKPLAIAISNGHTYPIPQIVSEKFPDLPTLISSTESMNDEEEEYWYQILPIMTEEQIKKFRDILVNERDQLAKLDGQYEEELARLNAKHEKEWIDFQERERQKAAKKKPDAGARSPRPQ